MDIAKQLGTQGQTFFKQTSESTFSYSLGLCSLALLNLSERGQSYASIHEISVSTHQMPQAPCPQPQVVTTQTVSRNYSVVLAWHVEGLG